MRRKNRKKGGSHGKWKKGAKRGGRGEAIIITWGSKYPSSSPFFLSAWRGEKGTKSYAHTQHALPPTKLEKSTGMVKKVLQQLISISDFVTRENIQTVLQSPPPHPPIYTSGESFNRTSGTSYLPPTPSPILIPKTEKKGKGTKEGGERGGYKTFHRVFISYIPPSLFEHPRAIITPRFLRKNTLKGISQNFWITPTLT